MTKFRAFMVGSTKFILLSTLSLCCIFVVSATLDTIAENQSIRDGNTIVSSGRSFELGFFSPGNSKLRYLGIWYKKISYGKVVWVANRDLPLNDSSGVIKIVDPAVLAIFSSDNRTVWSSNSSLVATGAVVAQLLDSGNFVLRPENDSDPSKYLWQSFDYPGDTFLPGMKYGIDLGTGLNRILTSWKSPDDPSTGDYTNGLDPSGVPQFFLRKHSVINFCSGPWNGFRFSGMPNLKTNPIYTFKFVFTKEEIYYTYNLTDSSVVSMMVLSTNGVLQRFTWIDRTQGWNLYLTAQMDNCDRYALCGAYGTCDINNSPACGCLKGFVPKYPQYWAMSDWSGGCVRKTPLDCRQGEGFLKYSGVKLPDTQHSWYNKTMTLEECEKVCLKNCSCTAYSNMDISGGGTGCILWFGELIDIREYADNGQDIYIRLSATELAAYGSSKGRKRVLIIVIPILCSGVILIGLCLILNVLKKRRKKSKSREGKNFLRLQYVLAPVNRF